MNAYGFGSCDGITGKTTSEMQTANTFLEAGWDFVGETVNGPNDIWKIVEDQMYPLLSWQKYGGGTGESNDPYLIYTAEHLNELGAEPNDYDKCFKLMADIDLSGYVYDRAVIAPDIDNIGAGFQGPTFDGSFDGNFHSIHNLDIKGSGYLGLFGRLIEHSEVRNVILANAHIYGFGDYIGILIGCNGEFGPYQATRPVRGGRISNCSGSGVVRGNDFVGGLIGSNAHEDVERCFADAIVQGSQNVGGLIGYQWQGSLITDSYTKGAVSGEFVVGGFIGGIHNDDMDPEIAQCYSATEVTGHSGVGAFIGMGGSANHCFYDHDIADTYAYGLGHSDGCEGLSTAEMQSIDTFRDAGWDVPGKDGGYHEIWQIPAEGGYPVLTVAPRLSGKGTSTNPYLINTPRELGAVLYHNPSAHFQLGSDIDLSGITWSRSVIPELHGSLDGNGHVVTNLTIVGAGSLGLVGELMREGQISNLGVVDANIMGERSYRDGAVESSKGMLVGSNAGTIIQCYSTGVARKHFGAGNFWGWGIGGLAGRNHGVLSDCYSDGVVSGDRVGGLVFDNRGDIVNCYSTCKVTGEYIGGLVGVAGNTSSFYSSFWDMEASGQITSAGGVGLTTTEMQTASTFLNAGWDFMNQTANGTKDIWWIDEGLDYPRLWWQKDSD